MSIVARGLPWMAMANPPHTAYSTRMRSKAAITASSSASRSSTSAAQNLPQRRRRAVERLAQFLRVLAAGLGKVRLAAPLPAHDRGELADERTGGDAVDQVLGHGGQQRDLAFVDAAEDDDAGLELGAQRVGEVAKIAAADVVRAAREQLHAADVDGAVLFVRRAAARGQAHLQLLDLLLVLLLLLGELARLLLRGGLALAEVVERAAAGEGLHAPHARGQRTVGDDLEHADVAGAIDVAAAAELLR